MVTKDDLKELGFGTFRSKPLEWITPCMDYMYVSNTQELFFVNDGVGDEELIAKIKDKEHLIEALENVLIKYFGELDRDLRDEILNVFKK